MLYVLCPYEFSSTRTPGPYIKRQRSVNEPTILEATSLKNIDAICGTHKEYKINHEKEIQNTITALVVLAVFYWCELRRKLYGYNL